MSNPLDAFFNRAIEVIESNDKETKIQLYFGSNPKNIDNNHVPFFANVVFIVPKNTYTKEDLYGKTSTTNTRRVRRTRAY